jgi:cysteine desulfurase
VVDAMLPYFTRDFGNAASKSHAYGWVAEEAVDMAREQVAALVHAEPSEIIFTSGATESVNLALRGVFELYGSKGKHIITTAVEHKAVLDTCQYLETIGAEVTVLPVDASGRVDPALVRASIRPDTLLISVMYANNETGVILPVQEIGQIAKEKGVLFFSDATQAVGKIPVDVLADGIDLLCLSAHKLYGPKGAGALYVRRRDPRVRLKPLQYGGGHEKGMRSGTLNVPGIVGLGKAADICRTELQTDSLRIQPLRDHLLNGLLGMSGATLNGDYRYLLPNTANISFEGSNSQVMLGKLSKQVALSSGSACTSATLEPSYVLTAMGLGEDRAAAALRFSLGRFTTEEEVEKALKVVKGLW